MLYNYTKHTQQIVGESSAVIDGFYVRKASIRSDHLGVCKFDNRADDGYKNVKGFILDILEEGKALSVSPSARVDQRAVGEMRIKRFEPAVESTTSICHPR
jgi:hypothetical protein